MKSIAPTARRYCFSKEEAKFTHQLYADLLTKRVLNDTIVSIKIDE
jgi:hypothetical protein